MASTSEFSQQRTGSKLELTGPAGKCTLRWDRPGLIEGVYDGVAYAHFAHVAQVVLKDIVTDGARFVMSIDATKMKSYESGYRQSWGDWLKNHRANVSTVVIHFSSPLVAMGINLVNPLVGNIIRAVSNEAAFAQAIAEATKKNAY